MQDTNGWTPVHSAAYHGVKYILFKTYGEFKKILIFYLRD